nr:von Willebrand factor type A domain-containing protein [Cohnella ginsengisoli]
MSLGLVLLLGALVAGCSSSSDYDSSNDSAPQSVSGAESKAAEASRATAPPSSAPYDMFFQDYGTNPYVSTADDRLSTFAMDVDTGSYTLARRYIEDGNVPPPRRSGWKSSLITST